MRSSSKQEDEVGLCWVLLILGSRSAQRSDVGMLPVVAAREGLLFIRTSPGFPGSLRLPVVTCPFSGLSPKLWGRRWSWLGARYG